MSCDQAVTLKPTYRARQHSVTPSQCCRGAALYGSNRTALPLCVLLWLVVPTEQHDPSALRSLAGQH
jgi:hypothetical protein